MRQNHVTFGITFSNRSYICVAVPTSNTNETPNTKRFIQRDSTTSQLPISNWQWKITAPDAFMLRVTQAQWAARACA